MDQYTILLVDDEPNILKALKRLFRKDHVRILTASNGQEALEIIKRESIQVLITDNVMPEMTGIELIKKVKERAPDIIRIVLSGQSDLQAVLTAVNEGEAFRFVLKPWNDIELRATVSLSLAHYKLAEDNKRLVSELREKSQLLDVLRAQHPEFFDTTQQEICYTIDNDARLAKESQTSPAGRRRYNASSSS
jgi:YesN/AraC family two-component response regulator